MGEVPVVMTSALRRSDAPTKPTGSRPVSFYDNYCENNGTNNNRAGSTTPTRPSSYYNGNSYDNFDRDKYDVSLGRRSCAEDNDDENGPEGGSPTQAYCLRTTVPQNIAAQNIANKHTPTRNSLRHSRMIAIINRHGRVPKKYLPAIIRYHKLAKALLGLLILTGSALCFLSLWLLLWAPNIRQRDNPHWSGIPVILSGIVGLFLLCCFRKEHPGMKKSYFVYSIKVLSISLSTLAAAASFIACAFAIIHLVDLYTMTCSPPGQLDTSCICRSLSTGPVLEAYSRGTNNGTVPSLNNTSAGPAAFQSYSYHYHYVDLTCLEVTNVLTLLVMFSCATNFISGTLEAWYVYLHWASRYVYAYSKVRTDGNNPMIFSNS